MGQSDIIQNNTKLYEIIFKDYSAIKIIKLLDDSIKRLFMDATRPVCSLCFVFKH